MTIPAAKVLPAEDYALIRNRLCGIMARAEMDGRELDTADAAFLLDVLRGGPVQGGVELEDRPGWDLADLLPRGLQDRAQAVAEDGSTLCRDCQERRDTERVLPEERYERDY